MRCGRKNERRMWEEKEEKGNEKLKEERKVRKWREDKKKNGREKIKDKRNGREGREERKRKKERGRIMLTEQRERKDNAY